MLPSLGYPTLRPRSGERRIDLLEDNAPSGVDDVDYIWSTVPRPLFPGASEFLTSVFVAQRHGQYESLSFVHDELICTNDLAKSQYAASSH